MKYYSKTTNGFYDSKIHKSMPADVVKITEAKHRQLLADQTRGGVIIADADGNPTIKPVAPLTLEEQAKHARAAKLAEKHAKALERLAWQEVKKDKDLDPGDLAEIDNKISKLNP